MTINPEYKIGQRAYILTDPEQYMRIVTKYIIDESGILYELSMGLNTIVCQACEISDTKNLVDFM
jgi:hypothetical protein